MRILFGSQCATLPAVSPLDTHSRALFNKTDERSSSSSNMLPVVTAVNALAFFLSFFLFYLRKHPVTGAGRISSPNRSL